MTAIATDGPGSRGGVALRPALFVLRHVAAASTGDSDRRAAYLSNLSGALLTLYHQDGGAGLLDDAVAAARQAVRTTEIKTGNGDAGESNSTVPMARDELPSGPSDHDLAARLMNLVGTLRARYRLVGSPEDLREALQAGRKAASLTSAPVQDRARNLSNLALVLLSHFEQTEDEETLVEAAAYAREAVALVPRGPGAALPLSNLSAVLGSLGVQTRDADVVRESVDAARRAVSHGGDALGGPEDFSLSLAQSLFDLYQTTDDTTALDECAEVCRGVLARLPECHTAHRQFLLTLGRALRARARSGTDRPAALAEAVSVLKEAAAATPPGHGGRADTLGHLMLAVQDIYDSVGDPEALDEAITTGRLAAEAAREDDPVLLKLLGNLANSLLDRYLRAGIRTDLDEAVEIGRHAVAVTPAGHADEAAHLTSLAHQLLVQYQTTGDSEFLEESIDTSRRAMGRSDEGSAVALAVLSNLSVALLIRFERSGSTEALDEAVSLRRQTVRATPADSPELAGRLSNLAGALRSRYDHTGDRAAIEEAAGCARRLMSIIVPGQPEYPLRMANVATTLYQWSELARDDAAGGEAEDAARLAVNAVPETHRARPALLSNLCGILLARYRRTGDLARLVDAESAADAAVRIAHPEDPDRPLYLLNLAMARRSQHERTGDLSVLREGMRAAEEGLLLTLAGNPIKAQLFNQISLGSQARYSRSGELRHLTESVTAAREAVSGCPPDHPDHAMYQSNLSGVLQMLHQRQDPSAAERTLEEAVAAARTAVTATERGHPDLPFLLSHLCGALMFQHGVTGGRRELAGAVTAGRRAVALTPPGHPNQTRQLANLAAAWRLRYRHDASPKALHQAVAAARRAVASLALDHPDEASVLTGCAAALRTASRAGAGNLDGEEVLRMLDRATNSTGSPIGDRISAARALGRAALDAGEADRALAAYETAVDLLGQLAPWRLARGDKEFGLGEMEGLGSEAAGAALTCGDPGRDVELLEQARGVMLNQTLDMRGDADELRAACPDLADEFEALRARRDAADHIRLGEQFDEVSGTHDSEPSRPVQRIAAERTAMDAEWHALLTRIRAVPGLSDFLDTPDLKSLRRQAEHGFVIILAVSRHRSDALVLTADPHSPVIVVALPEVTERSVIDWADRLLTGRVPGSQPLTAYAQAKRRMEDLSALLAWQWDHVAEPVLERIGVTRSRRPDEPGEWPRIWWCPTGATAFLPWHASGHHHGVMERASAPNTVMDRAVSSWTPTIRALAHARRLLRTTGPVSTSSPGTVAPGRGSGKGILIVEMPYPTGTTRPLRHVRTETAHIAGLLPDTTRLEPPHNTPEAVLGALPAHPTVHFACHAVSEWGAPGRSGLLLSNDDGTARLTVDAISSRNIADAELAYLSACSTTLTNQRLADESVHITAAFMLCGYRHVIGTLWPVDDATAGEIAIDFYTHLKERDSKRLPTKDSAYALHLSLHRARAKRPWAPSFWAAHLHTGA
ncbi:CHAT domain-containing protein [Streptomyces sp. NPDC002755]